MHTINIIIGVMVVVGLAFALVMSMRKTTTPKPQAKNSASTPTTQQQTAKPEYNGKVPVGEHFRQKPSGTTSQTSVKKPSTTERDPVFEEMMSRKTEGFRPNQSRKGGNP